MNYEQEVTKLNKRYERKVTKIKDMIAYNLENGWTNIAKEYERMLSECKEDMQKQATRLRFVRNYNLKKGQI